MTFFNNSNLGLIPFNLKIDIPAEPSLMLANLSLKYYQNFTYRGRVIGSKYNLTKNKFKKVNSGLRTWPTAKGNVEVELEIYYR